MLTIDTWLKGIGRKQQATEECPLWPPDLYALAGTLLRRSGSYLRVFERGGADDYLNGVEEVAANWRVLIEETNEPVDMFGLRSAVPQAVAYGWEKLIAARAIGISQIRDSCDLAENLIRMALIADAASEGIGIDWHRRTAEGPKISRFLTLADAMLCANNLQSFCWDVPRDVLCVLGKQHTPQRGATFRSMSHHLALYVPNDIEARWINPVPKTAESTPGREMLNLLLLPWPRDVETDDFDEVRNKSLKRNGENLLGHFRYNPKCVVTTTEFEAEINRAVTAAKKHAGTIDAILFPELALNLEQYLVAESIAFLERTTLICGMRQAGEEPDSWDLNFSVLQPAGALRDPNVGVDPKDSILKNLRLTQAKHHRWCLDRDQIVSYQLGGRLPTRQSCWEYIGLPHRVLHFVTLNKITWSVLVCEDLARQDPAADLIRAVGPNLLIALLMDGPQLSGRWPSRYASVLAEDPGTSVLTLTSLGMAERARPVKRSTGSRAEPSRVIALWRDAVAGEIQIALDPMDDACVLSLECCMLTEHCADGRGAGGETCYPVFAGFKSFRTVP